MGSLTQDVNTDYVLKAKIENVKNLSQLLKCINFKDLATCFASNNGLKFVVEDAKCVQAAAFVGADIFQEYELKDDIVTFRLDLNIFMECLTIFDNSGPVSGGMNPQTTMNLYYAGYGSPLRLILIEDDFITDCSIKTMEAMEIVHFSMPGENTFNKIIADGPQFKDIFNDLDPTSEYIDLFMSPDAPYFKITTLSNIGKCQISIPKDADMIEEFLCSTPAATRYKYSQIKPAMKPVQAATKISIQTDEIGLLCMQFMVKTESKQFCYIEYFCTPVLMEDSD